MFKLLKSESFFLLLICCQLSVGYPMTSVPVVGGTG